MKPLFVFLFVFLWVPSVYAQDLIVLRDGNTIAGKVMQVSSSQITYKSNDDLNVPDTISRANVLSIRYENRRVEIINPAPPSIQQKSAQANMPNSEDGQRNTQVQRLQTAANVQDLIIMRSGNIYEGKVMQVTPSQISYKSQDNLNGPEITASRAFVLSIKYEGDRVEIINPAPSARQSRESKQSDEQVLKLGEPNLLQQKINQLPSIPIAGKNLKFEFGGDNWMAKVNGQNFLTGDCIFEENGNGYMITLTMTNVWSGAVEEVIDLLQNIGVPLGPAAGPLKVAAKFASKIAKWIPLKGSSISLEYNEGPPVSLKLKSN
jgi:hypothetical protein